GGYTVITVGQLANGLCALGSGKISFAGFRAYLACFELVAIRAAAARTRKAEGRRRKVESRYRVEEVAKLTGLSTRGTRRAISEIVKSGLVEFSPSLVKAVKGVLPGSETLALSLAGGRSEERPIPVPRPLLRFLAGQANQSPVKVTLAYVVRGLSI